MTASPYKLKPVDSLIPYARNSRTHSDEQIAQIAGSIKEFGFINPVIVDGEGGIIAGHGRVMAARKLGLNDVPTIEVSHLTDAQRRDYILADNQLALNAGWDDEMLRIELGDLEASDFNIDVIGFSTEELGHLFDQSTGADGSGSGSEGGAGSLADRFGIPPFSVLNAREGWWQDRKRAWLAMGIKSELGRGEQLIPNGGVTASVERYKANATPGGSKMPAADYSKTKARGDGRGKAVVDG